MSLFLSFSLVSILSLALFSQAAADAKNSVLRGTHSRNPQQPLSPQTAVAAASQAVVGNAAAQSGATINLKHTMTTAENLGQNVPYPGMDYLGIGYDLLKGNPDGADDTKIDPGFRLPVVYLTWDQGDAYLSRDMANLQPKEGWALPETSCNMASAASESSTMSDYTSELEVAASVSAGYDGVGGSASFSASAGYQSFASNVVNKEGSQYSLRSYCVKYKAGLNRGPAKDTGIHPVASFETRAKALPQVPSCDGDASCVYVKHTKGGNYLTFTKQGDNWVAGLTKTKGPESMFSFNLNGDADSLTHATSGKALHVTIDASGIPKKVGASDDKMHKFRFDKTKGSITCTNCQKSVPIASTSSKAAQPGNPIAVHIAVKSGAVVAAAGQDTGAKPRWIIETVDTSAQNKLWLDFFRDYGTHFIDEVHLGGKMIFQMTLDKASQDNLKSEGVDVAAEFEGEYGPVSGSVSGSVASKSSKAASYASAKKTKKTTVLGGIPPEDPRTGFGQWAESVSTHPMPVKYTVRPLIEAGSAALSRPEIENTFNTMLEKYLSGAAADAKATIQAQIAANKGAPTLKPGEFWQVTAKGQQDKSGHTLKLTHSGRIIIYDRYDNGLWDSLASLEAFIYSDGRFDRTVWVPTPTNSKPSTLTYQTDGNLVMRDSRGITTWTSMTGINQCQGEGPGSVVFKGGVLKIKSKTGKVLWTSATASDTANVAKKAAVEYFGRGKPEAICVRECATLYTENNAGGTEKKLKPGIYKDITNANVLGADTYSFSVKSEECAMYYYAKANTLAENEYGQQEATIHVVPQKDRGELSFPGCTTGKPWALVQYPKAVAVVPLWDATIYPAQNYWGKRCNYGIPAMSSAEGAYSYAQKYLRLYYPSCSIGLQTGGVPQC
jgi:hypothetical protein